MELKHSPKLRHFAWQACKGFLATYSILRRRHIKEDDICPICKSKEKSLFHAVFECPHIKVFFWDNSYFVKVIHSAPNSSISVLFFPGLWKRVVMRNLRFFETLTNKVVLGGENPNVEVVIEAFISLVRGYKENNGNVYATQRDVSTRSLDKWVPPPRGWIKINTDVVILDRISTYRYEFGCKKRKRFDHGGCGSNTISIENFKSY